MSVIEPIDPGSIGGGGGPIIVVPGVPPTTATSATTAATDFLLPTLELQLDSGTIRHAGTGVTVASNGFRFDKRLISCGTISREIPIIQGLYSVGSVTVELDNTDQFLSILKSGTAWRNRRAVIRYGWVNEGYAEMQQVFTGVIEDWSFNNDRCQMTLRDNYEDKFQLPVSSFINRLVPGGYPDDTPTFSKNYLIPYLSGSWGDLNASTDNRQWFPGYCISSDGLTYILGHDSVEVYQVFIYGVFQNPAAYGLNTLTPGDGETYRIITFGSDPRDPNRSVDEIVVTWSGRSITATDLTHMNIVTALRGFLTRTEFVDIDSGRFDDIATQTAALGIVGGIGITNSEETIGEVLNKFTASSACPIFRNKAGQLSAVFLGAPTTPVISFTEKDVIEGTFKHRNNPFENLAATLQYNYDWNYAREFFHHQPDYVIPDSETELGEDIRDNISQWYGQSDDFDSGHIGALSVASLQGERMREGVQIVEFEVHPEHALTLELGDVVGLTHWEGIGSDGYADVSVHITGLHLNPTVHSSSLRIVGYVAAP